MTAPSLAWISQGTGDLLDRARAAGILSPLDRQFARRLADLYGEEDAGVRFALGLACRQEAEGHVCADLPRLSREGISTESANESLVHSVLATCDSVDEWIATLGGSLLVATEAVSDGSSRPLVLDRKGRLYLARAHRHQCEIVGRLRDRAEAPDLPVDAAWAENALRRAASDTDDDATRSALRLGLSRPLAVITGGPGTGKTTIVARLIALLAEEAIERGQGPPRVRLVAPTGKAAAALSESFARGRATLEAKPEIKAALPSVAETIHRVLLRQTRLDAFGRRTGLSLEEDIVVVDEASMVDLEMMNRLFEACASVPRVILLGDPDQLASVDSGAVLSEICAGVESAPDHALGRSITRLTRSHRFGEDSGIGRLAEAIRAGDADAVLALLADEDVPSVSRQDVGDPADLFATLAAESRSMQHAIEGAHDLHSKLDRMSRYRVLCAHRKGRIGVEAIGPRLDAAAASERRTTPQGGWWSGRLLLVTRNAPEQELWNGDVGLVEETDDGLRAHFPDGAGGVRALSAGRLPSHESAIAMSVHKSQGSEFDAVDLVLGDLVSPIMTRELFYTGVTRARHTLRVHASESAIRAMIARRIHRDSGLVEQLFGD